MIPEERLSNDVIRGALLNPWSRKDTESFHWGPLAVQDPSAGLNVQLWTMRAVGPALVLGAPGVPESTWFTHSQNVIQASLAWDQNARPVVAFVDAGGSAFLRWFDPVPNAVVTDPLLYATTPRVTLDDSRPLNLGNSDVILGYVRDGLLRYRRQRDRFTVEHTPTQGVAGPTAPASGLRHISMNSKLRLEFMTTGGEGTTDWTLPEVIEDLCHRVGLPSDRIGLTLLDWEKIVRGFTIGNAYAASGNLQTLSSVFFFDPFSAEGKVNFVARGRDAAATILEADMIDNDEPIEDGNTRRADPIAVPRVLHLNYYDVAGGLNTDKQRSERPEGSRADGDPTSLQTPVVLSADEAASVVARTHGLMIEQQKGELNFVLPDNWLGLTESDAVFVQTGTKMVRAILARVETDDGEQRYKAIRDRQSLYTTEVQGIPAAPVTRPPSSVAGPTVIEFLDIPILRDMDDQLGWRMAVAGILPAWPGALVELSLDGGANYITSETTRVGSIMGTLATALGDHPAAFPDEVNSCQVEITTPNAALVNTDLAGMMNRRNRAIIGDEVVSFADTDEVAPGTWELSHWLRGRKGTETAAHAIGARFVMLDSTMFIPAELAWLGRTLTFRAMTFGRPADEATIASVVFTGQSQVERQPAYLQARREGTDVVASWQGVGRLGGGANVAMGVQFAGFQVTLTDGSTTQTHNTLTGEFTGSMAAFTGPVTVRVQQRNQLTGLGPYIEVTI